ncbi:MAG TPA: GAF domain-containing protein, partial [Ktedonobacterales bacterium]|nr:GAF domain-containing protein [Ktedonobacterales bacterium]
MSQPNGKFVGAGGLPTRITHPEPGPLTVAATVQAQATRDIEALHGEMAALQTALQQMEGTLRDFREAQVGGAWTTPLTRTREVMARIAQAIGSLKELERAIAEANITIETLRAERGQLQALCLIAEHLNASMSRPDLMARVLDDLLMLLRSERGAILLANDKGDLHFEAARQANGTRLNSDEYPVSISTAKQVLTTGQPRLINDERSNGRSRIHSIMCAPLRISGRTLGIVYVDRLADDGLFTLEHLDLLAAFCNEATIAIENANLFAAQQLHLQEIAAMKTYTDSILTSIRSGVLAVDNRGRVTRANRALEEILDLREADVLDRPSDQVLAVIEDTELLTQLRVAIAQQNDGGSKLVQAPISGHSSRKEQTCTLSVGWSALIDNDNHRLGTVIVIDDLTDLTKAQREAEVFRRYVHP